MINRTIYFILIFLFLITGCKQKNKGNNTSKDDFEAIKEKKELTVLTLYSSTSYFLYKGEEMGYEYELIKQFAKSQGLDVKIVVAENISKLIEMLKEGKGDIIAYNIPVTGDTKNELLHCGRELITHQVLVQPTGQGIKPLRNVTELVGKDIYVEKDSKYEERINNLNDELGGGINIHLMDRDTLVTEDLIEMVAMRQIPYTLADNNIARLNKTYYNNIDINLEVSFPQRSSWVVRPDSKSLANAVNQWAKKNIKSAEYRSILKRYFQLSKNPPAPAVLSLKNGQISVYDHLFKKYAEQIDWDWRLIASQAFKESRFDTSAISWAGARGLMQIMPRTARNYGLQTDQMNNPEKSVATAVKILKSLDKTFSNIQPKEERIKFMLAAYNAGLGHVLDAIALAKKYGKDPDKWENNVAEYILLKSNPEYFNDEVCKSGYFRGRETINYVHDVLENYQSYKSKIPYDIQQHKKQTKS